MYKIAIVILADATSHSDLARVVNAFETAKEFKEAGDAVDIIFDGGGVVAAVELANPEHRAHRLYASVQDKVSGVCSYCAKAFGVYEKAQTLNIPLGNWKQ